MRTIQVVIDDDVHARLVAEAKKRKISLGDHLRALLQEATGLQQVDVGTAVSVGRKSAVTAEVSK